MKISKISKHISKKMLNVVWTLFITSQISLATTDIGNDISMPSNFIRRDIACFSQELPPAGVGIVRFVSYNILASFMTDEVDLDRIRVFESYKTHPTWLERSQLTIDILHELNPSIINLQEATFPQLNDIIHGLGQLGKHFAVSGHVPYTGKSLSECSAEEFKGFGNPTLYNTAIWKLEKNGIFWLKEDTDIPPAVDKEPKERRFFTGFGDEENCRSVEWSIFIPTLESLLPRTLKILILGSHFSLSASRIKCTELIIHRLKELVATELDSSVNSLIMVSGDFNLFPDEEGEAGYRTLSKLLKNYRDALEHFGFAATFIGAESDKFCSEIDREGRIVPNALDYMGFSPLTVSVERSFSLAGEFDINKRTLIKPLVAPMRTNRHTISDHCLIGADIKVDLQ